MINWKILALFSLIIGGLLYRISLLFANDTMLTYWIMDDACYYLKTAQNIATTGKWSFDGGISITNGFHPLYMFACVCMAKLVGNCEPTEFLRIMLTVSSIVGVLGAWVIYKIAELYSKSGISLIMVTCYLFSLPFVSMHLNGMETSFYVTILALTMYLSLSQRSTWMIGIALSLCVLARTEAVILVIIYSAWLVVNRKLKGAIIVAVIPFIAFCVFSILSYVNTGYILQTSGTLKLGEHSWGCISITMKNMIHSFSAFFPSFYTTQGGLLVVSFIVFIPVLIVSIMRTRILIPYIAFIMFLIVFYSRTQGYTPLYYLGCHTIILFICITTLICKLAEVSWRRLEKGKPYVNTIMVISLLFVYGNILNSKDNIFMGFYNSSVPYRQTNIIPHMSVYNTAMECKNIMPPNTIIGSFDAGVIGYYSKFPCVNLDGVINSDAATARMNGKLLEYILSKPITYIVQPRDSTYTFFTNNLELAKIHIVPIHAITNTYFYGGHVIYKIVK